MHAKNKEYSTSIGGQAGGRGEAERAVACDTGKKSVSLLQTIRNSKSNKQRSSFYQPKLILFIIKTKEKVAKLYLKALKHVHIRL